MKQLFTVFFILSLTLYLSACVPLPEPYMLYKGDPVPTEKLARIRVPNVKIFVRRVDGENLWSFVNGLLDKSEVLVSPGKHKLWVSHTANETASTYQNAETEIEFTAEPGHMYTVLYQDIGTDKIAFYIRDHGTDYNQKCASQLNKPNMAIYIGHQISPECY